MPKTNTLSSTQDLISVFVENSDTLENYRDLLAYRKMYNIMFNAVTDAMEKIQDAEAILHKAQQRCGQTFLETVELASAWRYKSTE